jgi:hypothetical protein
MMNWQSWVVPLVASVMMLLDWARGRFRLKVHFGVFGIIGLLTFLTLGVFIQTTVFESSAFVGVLGSVMSLSTQLGTEKTSYHRFLVAGFVFAIFCGIFLPKDILYPSYVGLSFVSIVFMGFLLWKRAKNTPHIKRTGVGYRMPHRVRHNGDKRGE